MVKSLECQIILNILGKNKPKNPNQEIQNR
jgi:hypothetical protein